MARTCISVTLLPALFSLIYFEPYDAFSKILASVSEFRSGGHRALVFAATQNSKQQLPLQKCGSVTTLVLYQRPQQMIVRRYLVRTEPWTVRQFPEKQTTQLLCPTSALWVILSWRRMAPRGRCPGLFLWISSRSRCRLSREVCGDCCSPRQEFNVAGSTLVSQFSNRMTRSEFFVSGRNCMLLLHSIMSF
jgi:hypothetical protein